MRRVKYGLVAVSMACLALSASPASAGATIAYRALDRSLPETIDDIARMLHVPMSITHADNIRVQDWQASGDATAVIDQLAKNFALVYFFDGSSYRFVPAADARPRVIFVEPERFSGAASVVRALFPRASLDAIQLDRASGMIVVRGPDGIAEDIDKAIKAVPSVTMLEKRPLFIRAGIPDDGSRGGTR